MALIPGRARVLELKWTRGTAREKVKCYHPSRNFHRWLFHGLSPVVLCTLEGCSTMHPCLFLFDRPGHMRIETSRERKRGTVVNYPIPGCLFWTPLFTVDRDNGSKEDRPVDFYRRFREFRENCLVEKSRWRFWIRFEFGDRWIMEWKLWWVTNIFFFFWNFWKLGIWNREEINKRYFLLDI